MSPQLRLSLYSALATMTAATALSSEFIGKAWVVPVMGAILLVSAGCAAVRASPLPSAFEPVVAALLVLLWITGLDAHHHAHFGFVPGRVAFRHLGRVARNGFTQIHQLPTPAPYRHGLVMLTVIAVAAVALVVDLIVVTLRRAALAGLPLLGLFTVCAATGHNGVSLLPFVLAAVGYLWLLYADNREKVARWGAAVGAGPKARPASAWSTDPASAPPPASLGRRVGATAITVSVVVPFLIPGLHTGIDKQTVPGHGNNGGGSTQVQDPIVNVAADLKATANSPILTYQSTSSHPGYLRMTALDQFNGSAFSGSTLTEGEKSVANETLPVATPPPGPTVTTSITFLPQSSGFELRYLPAPAIVLGTSVAEPWRYDPRTATIYSAAATTRPGMHYTTRSVANQPTAAALAAAGKPSSALAADQSVPQSMVSPRVVDLTKQITAKAKNNYQAALDIQRYFTEDDRFTYTTKIPADTSANPLANFLFNTRKGFCQQFATAMAAMARLYGIPARVAVGFTPGTRVNTNSNTNTYIVTSHDAHAWPELWFQGYGWLAFEPTPRADGQAVTPSYASQKIDPSKVGGGRAAPTPKQTTSPNVNAGRHNPLGSGGSSNSAGGASGVKHHHAATSSSVAKTVAIGVILGVLVLALILPGLLRSITRRRRWRVLHRDPTRAASTAWQEIRDTTLDLGGAWDDGRSPRQLAAGLLAVLGPATDLQASVRRLAHAEERARYAAAAPPVEADLRHDVALLREAIAASRTGTWRLRARVWPRSTLLVARSRLSVVDRGLHRASQLAGRARGLAHQRPKPRAARG
jgi:transglutaminase-like putative cysteine protease